MTQKERVLVHMQTSTITQRDAYELYGIMRLGAIIHTLKKEGHKIASIREQEANRYGETTYYARYTLLKPENDAADTA